MLRRLIKPKIKPADLKKPTVIILILSNLLPIYGVLFLGWEVFPIMLLFWTENVIIGVFNILKMLMCSPASPAQWVAKLFLVPFFSVHYGGFAMAHGFVIFALFGGSNIEVTDILDLTKFLQLVGGYNFVLGFLTLFLSHCISFVMNYILKGEYKQASPGDLMFQPYGRVGVLHITIIFGGFILLALGSPTGGLIILIVLKLAIDVLAHLTLHAAKRPTVSKSGFTAR